jgi:hypothetical protein
MNKQQIDYIAGFLGIDVNNDYILKDLAVSDADSFIKFMKKNILHVNLDFKNPLQKLTILKDLFTKEQNIENLRKSNNLAHRIAEKVKATSSLVLRSDFEMCDYQHFFVNQKPLFEKWEIKLLKKIGNVKQVVALQRSSSGNDNLCDELKKIIAFKAVHQSQLSFKNRI